MTLIMSCMGSRMGVHDSMYRAEEGRPQTGGMSATVSNVDRSKLAAGLSQEHATTGTSPEAYRTTEYSMFSIIHICRVVCVLVSADRVGHLPMIQVQTAFVECRLKESVVPTA